MGQTPLGFNSRSFGGALGPQQVDVQRAMWQSSRHGKYYAAVYGTPALVAPNTPTPAQAGAMFRGSNSTAATLSAALATTYTGLCLSNPIASTVNLAIKKISAILIVAPAAELGFGLITGWSAAGVTAHTTSLQSNITPAYVGAAASSGSVALPATQAKLDAACTIVGTPLWDRWLDANGAAVDAKIGGTYDIDDDLIIPPGGYVAIGATVTGPTSGFFGTIGWEEIAP